MARDLALPPGAPPGGWRYHCPVMCACSFAGAVLLRGPDAEEAGGRGAAQGPPPGPPPHRTQVSQERTCLSAPARPVPPPAGEAAPCALSPPHEVRLPASGLPCASMLNGKSVYCAQRPIHVLLGPEPWVVTGRAAADKKTLIVSCRVLQSKAFRLT